MRRRLLDVGTGVLMVVLLGCFWYVRSLGALVARHELVVQALIRSGMVTINEGPAKPAEAPPPGPPPTTPEARK